MSIGNFDLQEDWMTTDERSLARRFAGEVKRLLEQSDVRPGPLLALRVNDVVNSYILVRRAEQAALMPEAVNADAVPAKGSFDDIGKARDRLRKAMQELDGALPAQERPQEVADLASFLRPIYAKANGIVDGMLVEKEV